MKLTIMTFNIQHGRDYVKRVIDLKLMSQTIKTINPDVVCLNEVFNEGPNPKFVNQAKEIADELGYNYFFGKAIVAFDNPYGNAILSKFPIDDATIYDIPDPLVKDEDTYYEHRSIIKATIKGITFVCTHMGLAKSERNNAVQKILELSNDSSFVLMGDFNSEPDDVIIKPLKDRFIDTCLYIEKNKLSFPSINPVKKIDYIFVSKDFKVLKADIPEIVASDHYPCYAIIESDVRENNFGCCGFNCDMCPLFLASKYQDNDLKDDITKIYSLDSDSICLGCLSHKHVKYCENCTLRSCCLSKGIENCGKCEKYPNCEIVERVINTNPTSKAYLDEEKKKK